MKVMARNRKGNVLLQVLMATAVMSTSFYFLSNYVISQRQQVGKTMNIVRLRFALNSAMDYVIYGVRQKFCFTNDNLLLNEMGSSCTLANTGSVERLIMSLEQENFIRQLIADGKNVGALEPNAIEENKVGLKSIVRYIDINKATALHPLFSVLDPLKRARDANGESLGIGAIRVVLTRNDNINLPKAGREVYLQLRVDLVDGVGSTNPLKIGSKDLSISSQVTIYPREVGSFALLVPNDLYLDRSWDASIGVGDVSLHKFTNRKELGTSPGLVFQSPVFVNRNIHLPTDDGGENDTADSINYAAVTFAERVYMGNGSIMSKDANFKPKSSGRADNRLWSDVRSFGGFLKGIENDGGLDAGLMYLADKSRSVSVDKELMAKCSELGIKQADVASVSKSQLGAKLTSSGSNNKATYRLTLSDWNTFNPQTNALIKDTSKWGNGTAKYEDTRYNEGVVKIYVDLGGRVVEAQLPINGELQLKAEVGSQAYEDSLKNAITSKTTAYDTAKKNEADTQLTLSGARVALNIKEAALAAEQSKPVKPAATPTPSPSPSPTPTPSPTVSPTPEETPAPTPVPDTTEYQNEALIASLTAEINDLKRTISELVNSTLPSQSSAVTQADRELQDAKNKLNTYTYLKANAPRINIFTKEVKTKWGNVSDDKIDVEISASNVTSMIDASGNQVQPIIGIQAYDGTYYKSAPLGKDENRGLLGFINVGFNNYGSELSFPPAMVRDAAGTAISIGAEDDRDELLKRCEEARGTMTSASFGGAGWDVSFASTARTSWNFAGNGTSTIKSDPAIGTLELNNFTTATPKFHVQSIVGKCIINKSTTFLTGFFTCDELEIPSRDKPLRIIGTFIVGKMKIHPSAYQAGITWSSIYQPQATRELRAAKVLKGLSPGKDCNAPSTEPIWHPIPSIKDVSDRMACNTISLRAKADPFQWTAVDPDCGIAPNTAASNTTCKRRLVRFFVVEQAREGGM